MISELRKPRPHGAAVEWISLIDERDLYLSVATIAEIQAGIEITRQQDIDKADQLETWLNRIIETQQILPMDANVFRLWAKLMHRRSNTLYEDAMIAATAKVHRLVVVTRNVKDFEAFDVEVLNPFHIRHAGE